MKWTEDDEKQVGEFEPGGIYPFEIAGAEERVSQNGNPYINVKLRVYVGDVERTLYDNLMPKMPNKLKAFCEAMGLQSQLASRTLSVTDCSVGDGYIRLTKKQNKDGYYQVDGYLSHDPRLEARAQAEMSEPIEKPAKVSVPQADSGTDDDGVPF